MTQKEFNSQVKKRLATRLRLSDTDMELIMQTAASVLIEAVASGEAVKLRNLGTFQPKERPACVKHVGSSGVKTIPARRVAEFVPGKALRDALWPSGVK